MATAEPVPEGHPDVDSLGEGSELCPYLRRTSGGALNHTPANGGVVPGLVTVAVLLDMLGVAIVIPLLPTYAKVRRLCGQNSWGA